MATDSLLVQLRRAFDGLSPVFRAVIDGAGGIEHIEGRIVSAGFTMATILDESLDSATIARCVVPPGSGIMEIAMLKLLTVCPSDPE